MDITYYCREENVEGGEEIVDIVGQVGTLSARSDHHCFPAPVIQRSHSRIVLKQFLFPLSD